MLSKARSNAPLRSSPKRADWSETIGIPASPDCERLYLGARRRTCSKPPILPVYARPGFLKLTGLLEADLAVVSNQLNEVMKKVTSWGAILVVGTLITGVYGMNFHDMPELSWSFGYPLALTTIVAVMFGLWVMFKRKNWL